MGRAQGGESNINLLAHTTGKGRTSCWYNIGKELQQVTNPVPKLTWRPRIGSKGIYRSDFTWVNGLGHFDLFQGGIVLDRRGGAAEGGTVERWHHGGPVLEWGEVHQKATHCGGRFQN